MLKLYIKVNDVPLHTMMPFGETEVWHDTVLTLVITGTRWKGVISLTPWPLYPPGKEHVVLPFPRAVCFTSVYIVVLHCYTP